METSGGAGALTKTGAGQLTLGGTNNNSGGTTLAAGTLKVDSTGSLTTAGSTVTVAITGDNTTLTNAGSISQTGTGRAIDVATANLTITVTNSGSINTVSTDAFRLNANSAVSLTNSGTIAVSAGGQAIDWAAVTSKANSLTNQATGIITSVGDDAVRPGTNGVVINAGTITATPTGGASPSGSDGIDVRTFTGIQITNTGTITGRHGIATDGTNISSAITVNNNTGGLIQAVNGSGLNIDGVSVNVTANVTNQFGATIKGGVQAAATNGDGDGIDIDGVLTLNNYGDIFGLGAKGAGSDTLPNGAQAVSVGGGTIHNYSTGQIIGSTLLTDAPNGDDTRVGEGILADNSSGGNAVAVTNITNDGLIRGKSGAGIRLIGTFANTIDNTATGTIRGAGTGAAIQTGNGNDTINNSGAIIGDNGLAIDLGGGNNTLNITGGSASILGSINGGSGGTNSLAIDPGTGNTFSYAGIITNFSSIKINSGSAAFGGQILAITNSTLDTNGRTLTLTGGIVKNGTVFTIKGGGTVNINNTGISGSSANSDLIVDGTTVNENTANSYNGPTYIRNGGVLNANVTNALPTTNGRTAVILDDTGSGNSKLALGANQSAASLSGNATSTVDLGSNVLTVGTASGSTTLNGLITGITGGGIIKDGASSQIFAGSNTYAGGTSVNVGTLLAKNATNSSTSATGFGAVTVANGATLGGTGTIGKTGLLTPPDITINGNSTPTLGGALMIGDTHNVNTSLGGTASRLTLNTSSTGLITLGGMIQFDIFSRVAGGGDHTTPINTNDLLDLNSYLSIALGSNSLLSVKDPNNIASTFARGDSWKLVDLLGIDDSSAFTGTFASFDLPTGLGEGLTWDITHFYEKTGTYAGSILVTPEPGRMMLLLLGVMGAVLRRRRSGASDPSRG